MVEIRNADKIGLEA